MMNRARDEERFEALAQQRVKLGLSVTDIAEKTQIPIAHLEALEGGSLGDIPPGPYLDGYYRAYCRALGLKPLPPGKSRVDHEKENPPSAIPLWVVRGVAMVAAGSLLAWAGIQLFGLESRQYDSNGESPATPIVVKNQVVKLWVRKKGHFKVSVDDAWIVDKVLQPGDMKEFRATQKIEIIVPGAGSVRLEYNGRSIVPQGLQDKPRRLIFMEDDEGGA